MKKLIVSLSFLSFFTFAAINECAAQTAKEDVVLVSFQEMSASKVGVLNNLTYGKPGGFDPEEKAFIVMPADASKETLDKLVEEIKYKSPGCTVKITSIDTKAKLPAASMKTGTN